MTGVLGGYTTFSTFSLDVALLAGERAVLLSHRLRRRKRDTRIGCRSRGDYRGAFAEPSSVTLLFAAV